MITREELYHPLFAHFPIVLFLLVLFFKLLVLLPIKNSEVTKSFALTARILLFMAPLFYLVTMYLGDSAYELIKSNFCDLKSIHIHEETAKTALIFIILNLVGEGLSEIHLMKSRYAKFTNLVMILFLLTGNFYILKTAHSGALLVYDQGAAVLNSVQKCH